MAQDGGSQQFQIQYEEGGDLPVFIDHIHATTIEHGIYMTMATMLPPREKRRPEASVQATLYLPVSAIAPLHSLVEGFRRHIGGQDAQFTHEAVELRYDKLGSDVPHLADFFSCSGTPDGIRLMIGRQSAAAASAVSVFSTYHLTARTMLQLHWLVDNIARMIRTPEPIGQPAQTH